MPQDNKQIRASRDGLVRQLQNADYKVDTFEVQSVGRYAVADADWNYKDVPHLNIVHTKVSCIIGSMDADHITTINLQKVLGIALPVVVVNYATAADAQTYYTTLGPYVLVVHTRYEAVAENETRVITQYNVAAKGPATLLFGLLRRVLKGNYKTLMSEDLPMRDRRGELRARGFRFRSDGRPRTFPETTDLITDNVIAPERAGVRTDRLSLDTLLANGAAQFVGPDDDRGVRLVREGDEILVLPRVCLHEGASLDESVVKNGQLVCPWHAKRISPLARIACREGATVESSACKARVENGQFVIELPSESGTVLTSASAI